MCYVSGLILKPGKPTDNLQWQLAYLLNAGLERGRDSIGVAAVSALGIDRQAVIGSDYTPILRNLKTKGAHAILINHRAEPTTERVKDKTTLDTQPFVHATTATVHNGTIANDLGFERSHPIIDSGIFPNLLQHVKQSSDVREALERVKGSYAIAIAKTDVGNLVWLAANYKPIWLAEYADFWVFASSKTGVIFPGYTPLTCKHIAVHPYQLMTINRTTGDVRMTEIGKVREPGALCVCSGGLDSTVAAAMAVAKHKRVCLLHFRYGCNAEVREVERISKIARALGCEYEILELPYSKIGGSKLFESESKTSTGIAGSEYAHEWVPARNLVMLSLATAYAEAHGFGSIYLGNNLEESGAYPDNEPEFIRLLNKVLPFATQNGVEIEIMNPLGNLMKHEIVSLGIELNAPLAHTWSCYKAGDKHCGNCGPCFMRKTAFEMNGMFDPVFGDAQ